MSEPQDTAGSQGDAAQKKVTIIAALIGLNVLCLAALAGASVLLPRGPVPIAAAEHAPEKTGAAKEDGKEAETTAAVEAKAPDAKAASAKTADMKTAAAAEPAQGVQRAVVVTPNPKGKAVLRMKPEPRAPVVVMLPPDTKIEVISQTSGKPPWYQVKTVGFEPASTGWLHPAVVKME